MAGPANQWKYRRARRRFMGAPTSAGRTGWVAALLVVVIGGVTLFLELRMGGRTAALVERVAAVGVDPLDLVAGSARSRRLVVLGDVRGSVRTKQFAAEVVEALASTSGLDAVLVQVDPAAQPWIDRYLETEPENVTLLLERPRTLGALDGAGTNLLDVYRRVWRLNRQLEATRRIRIFTADAEGWPPAAAISPAQAVQRYGDRDRAMMDVLMTRVHARDPTARVLLITDGMHALRGKLRLQTGGTPTVEFSTITALAEARYPGQVFSILVDAPPLRGITPQVMAYRGTVAGELLRRSGARASRFGLLIDGTFGSAAEMVVVNSAPGITFSLASPDVPLASLADGYIFLGSVDAS